MTTLELLKKCWPYSTELNRNKFAPYLDKYMSLYDISSPVAMACFLAQIGHESAQLRYVEEIASGASYEGRTDLGNTEIGDGKRFKGRGLIQITGRTNYKQISDDLGIDFVSSPELLTEPEFAVESACWWWNKRDLTWIAESAPIGDYATFRRITKIINGGYNGFDDRWELYQRAIGILT